MASILDGLGLEGSVLDGLAEWPASTTRKEWFRLTRELVQKTMAQKYDSSEIHVSEMGWFRNTCSTRRSS